MILNSIFTLNMQNMTFQLNAQPPLLDQSNRNPQADRHPILEQKQMHNMLNMLIDIKYAKYVKYASAPLHTSPRTSGPRPIPRAQFLSLAPHARALQLGPRVPNHPRPSPPTCTPTHLRASAHPARTFSLRRRCCRQKQCEP